MTLILVSTSARHTPTNKPSGHLFVLDLENQEVIQCCEIIEPPYREENPNPRGGLRGLKGISLQGDRIAIANASTIFLYDEKWNPLGHFFHPSCAGIHDILLNGDKIWVTCARNDLLCCFDFNGNLLKFYDARTFKGLINIHKWQPKPFLSPNQIINGEINFRDPRTHDEIFSDTSHINGLSMMKNGDLLVSCGLLKNPNHLRLLTVKNLLIRNGSWGQIEQVNRFIRKHLIKMKNRHSGELIVQPAHGYSAIFRITPEGKVEKCLIVNGATAPSHSVRVLSNGTAFYLKTTTGEIIHFDPDSGETLSITQIGESFLRGGRELPDGTLILGDNNKLVHFDLAKHKIISSIKVSEETTEAIFDFCILPKKFNLPPMSFVEHHEKLGPAPQI